MSDGLNYNDFRMRRIRGWEFEGVVPWERVIEEMDQDVPVKPKHPPVREAHCQCCGGYAGHGRDPEYCGRCRRAGEHKDGDRDE